MQTISAEQAVFTSSDRGSTRGYQLVSKSAGIDRELSQELCRWSPTHSPSLRGDDWTLNSFPLSGQRLGVARTTLGGPEYSDRGGMQVVTLILVIDSSQLEHYEFNPVTLARTALAMGSLRLPLDLDSDQRSTIILPAHPLLGGTCFANQTQSVDRDDWLDHVTTSLDQGCRVAVIGAIDPVEAASQVINHLPIHARNKLSFTTGLDPSLQRPFQLQFFASTNLARQRALDSQNIRCLRVPAEKLV